MKKAVSLFCLILIALGATLTLLGSKSTYIAEARFWKARAFSQQIVANPETTPPFVFKQARERFERIMKEYSGNAMLVKESLLSIAGLLIHEKKYQEARDFIYKIRKDYPEDNPFGARSQFLLGFSYEKAGDWEAALREYRILRDRYAKSYLGLEVPLYIARHDIKEDSQKGAERYEEAAAYYQDVAQNNPKSPLKFFALNYMLSGYEEQKKWDKSLDTLQEIILAFPKSLRAYVPKIEAYSRRAKAPEKAAAIYESFIQAYPDHKDAMVIKKRIERLRKSRKNVS